MPEWIMMLICRSLDDISVLVELTGSPVSGSALTGSVCPSVRSSSRVTNESEGISRFAITRWVFYTGLRCSVSVRHGWFFQLWWGKSIIVMMSYTKKFKNTLLEIKQHAH